MWAMHPRNAPSAADGFSPLTHGTPNTWFLTIDARHTKYCGGLAPEDQRRRTFRQIGNLRGREQRELADDHPIKAIYTRRMNTILQSTRRGKLDDETAAAMKKLAKDKMLRAITDTTYAQSDYPKEMEQDTLLKDVLHRGRCNRT